MEDMKKLMPVLLLSGFVLSAHDRPVVKGQNVSMASARQETGVPFPDQYIVALSNLSGVYQQVRVTVRYTDANGSGEFIANATITNRTAVFPMPIADAATFISVDIWVDYGNTTPGYDYPQQ